MTPFEIALLVLGIAILALCIALLFRTGRSGESGSSAQIEQLGGRLAELHGAVTTGVGGLRDETNASSRQAREELAGRLDGVAKALADTLGVIGTGQGDRLEALVKAISNGRIESEAQAKGLREELTQSFDKLGTGLTGRMSEQGVEQARRLDSFATQLVDHRKAAGEDALSLRQEVGGTLAMLGRQLTDTLDLTGKKQAEGLVAVTGATRDLTETNAKSQDVSRTALLAAVKDLTEANERRQEALRTSLLAMVKDMTDSNERRQDELRKGVEGRLDQLRTENAAKLEEMRVTVDEKLQGTLEARLGASFTTVNENLERVFKSVGEMQTIATGVGDLKRVLTNVKLRGSYGETTLGMLLEQVMTTEQYAQNVEIKPGSGQRVEYAIKLPGEGADGEGGPLWLPIDVKLPKEDYERLVDASERGDALAVEEATRGLERTIRKSAGDIRDKYVDPPHSTDFGIMFLPTEGLFAEVTRRPGLIDTLQREYRVVVAGPTTLMATLVSLRMGFRSLAIQKRSSEVWQVLGAVKSEFGKFGDVLDKVHKKLGEAQKVVDDAGVRRRAMDRQLRKVEALPEAVAHDVLAVAADNIADDIEGAAE
jgi:DNA recombination protein RmuC